MKINLYQVLPKCMILSTTLASAMFTAACIFIATLNAQESTGSSASTGLSSETSPAVGSMEELLDFDAISKVKPWRTFKASSASKDGLPDYSNWQAIEPGRRFVMLDVKGRGSVDRFWTTYRKGDPEKVNYNLEIFIDGEEEPSFKMDLNDFFNGTREPFVEPLTGRCGFAEKWHNLRANYSYRPIGFEKSCKMVIVQVDALEKNYDIRTMAVIGDEANRTKGAMVYYQIEYRLCNDDNIPVERFQMGMTPQKKATFEAIQEIYGNAGDSLWPPIEKTDDKSAKANVALKPNQTKELLAVDAPGTLREILMTVKTKEDSIAERKQLAESLWLDMTWDDAASPQVSVPLTVFFMAPDKKVGITALWAGCRDEKYYCYFPMPFFKNAKVTLRTTDALPEGTEVNSTFRWTPRKPSDDRALFHATRYDHPSFQPGEKFVVGLATEGRGHLVGICSDYRGSCEDDDACYIDGEEIPSIYGTGTEDFYNFAWGLGDLQTLPFHGMRTPFGDPAKRDIRDDQAPLAYRFHPVAGYPYEKSLRFSWFREAHKRPGKRYAGIVYYYQD